MHLPPPISTLFPYTTLFRSNKSTPFKEGETVIAEVKFAGLDTDYEQYGGAVGTPVYESDFRKVWREKQSAIHPDEDRKSTRLNSSHLVISYAVFCLKKKKIQ